MMRLQVSAPSGTRIVVVAAARARLGRLPGCEVVVDEPGVSREHAEIVARGSGWMVRDLGSANGTFVNGEPVDSATLGESDEIGLGPEVTVRLLGGADDAGAGGSDDATATRETGPHGAARPGGARAREARGPLAWLREERWTLVPRAGGAPVAIHDAVTVVGRDAAAGLTLADESVSRTHARLDRAPDGLTVSDLKSRNGTFVNDEPVLRAALAGGDELRFGDVAFDVGCAVRPAWKRIGVLAGALVAVTVVALVVLRIADVVGERAVIGDAGRRMAAQAVTDTRAGIAASRAGDAELARAYLLHAADLLSLADLAPRGATLARPREYFRAVLPRLPAEEREFDFAAALDPAAIEQSQARIATLTNREYVDHQLRRYAVELGQDPDVPPGFADMVWNSVREHERYPNSMRIMLRRARTIQPRIRTILASRHLPEAFCHVAWVESGLDPMQRSPKGALGLWQLMPATARELKLRVDEANPAADQRTDIERSTAAAADYIATLLRDQGPEYFMLVLASYNRGPGALDRAKQKVSDPMLPAARKYWYLVEHGLLPEETRNYVPRIFAVRLIYEAPERFGFER